MFLFGKRNEEFIEHWQEMHSRSCGLEWNQKCQAVTLLSGQRHLGNHEFHVLASTGAVAADQKRDAHTEEAK